MRCVVSKQIHVFVLPDELLMQLFDCGALTLQTNYLCAR